MIWPVLCEHIVAQNHTCSKLAELKWDAATESKSVSVSTYKPAVVHFIVTNSSCHCPLPSPLHCILVPVRALILSFPWAWAFKHLALPLFALQESGPFSHIRCPLHSPLYSVQHGGGCSIGYSSSIEFPTFPTSELRLLLCICSTTMLHGNTNKPHCFLHSESVVNIDKSILTCYHTSCTSIHSSWCRFYRAILCNHWALLSFFSHFL